MFNVPFGGSALQSMLVTFLLNTAILCSCSSILSFSLPISEMIESSLFLSSESVSEDLREYLVLRS